MQGMKLFKYRPFKKLRIDNGDGSIMMIRWYITGIAGLKLHKFIASDKDCMHDHPWAFVSVMLWGSYIEETDAGQKTISSPAVMYRRAEHKHRILYTGKTCWTLVLTFRRVREWGFFTKEGWVQWFNYFRKGNRAQCGD